jgi:hypothetical protein
MSAGNGWIVRGFERRLFALKNLRGSGRAFVRALGKTCLVHV